MSSCLPSPVLNGFLIPVVDLIDRRFIFLRRFRRGWLCDPAGRRCSPSDVERPREAAYYLPDAPEGQVATQVNDLVVGADGLVYVTDRIRGGLCIFERT